MGKGEAKRETVGFGTLGTHTHTLAHTYLGFVTDEVHFRLGGGRWRNRRYDDLFRLVLLLHQHVHERFLLVLLDRGQHRWGLGRGRRRLDEDDFIVLLGRRHNDRFPAEPKEEEEVVVEIVKDGVCVCVCGWPYLLAVTDRFDLESGGRNSINPGPSATSRKGHRACGGGGSPLQLRNRNRRHCARDDTRS